MISRLHIKNYKCLHDEDMEFRPLTVLTGTNSSGKSSVLQAVLLLARNCNPKNRERMYDLISEYQELLCDASLTLDGTEYRYSKVSDSNSDADILRWEDSLYFLTANRVGPESVAKMSKEYKVGNNGEFLFGTLFQMQFECCQYITDSDLVDFGFTDKSVSSIFRKLMIYLGDNGCKVYRKMGDELVCINRENLKDIILDDVFIKSWLQLHFLVNFWLCYITESDICIISINISSNMAKIYFTKDGQVAISPFNLGSGMSYLAKVLILCFLAKPGDVVMIENPEIHLHPRAQSRLGEFFAFMAGKGIQLVIETHCEHLLSSLRYQVYKDRLRSDDVILYYKADDKTPFEQLRINESGRYMNREGKQCGFPKGFFDVSVRQLMEIG